VTGGGTIGVVTAEESYAATGIIGPAKAKTTPAYVSQLESLADDAFDVDVDEHFVKVLATDELGNVYPAEFVEPRRFTGLSKAGKTTFRKGTARFTIAGLPPGDYTVSAQLKGFKTASQHRTVESGKTLKVTFVLVRETLPGGVLPDKPDALAPGGWIGPGWWGKLGLIPKYPLWPWPPPEERPGFDPVFDPPPYEVEVWLQDWAAWLKGQYPEAAIDPGGIHVYVARDHTPDSIPDAAYAYAVFGEGGAYLPVLLAPTDRAFPTDVPVAKGELAGIDAQLAAELAASGLGDLDLLAAGWTGLVGAALGVGPEAAAGVIAGSRTKVDELQGTLLTLGGVDSGLADALATVEVAPGVAIDSPVALANADPRVLATELADQGMTLAFATRLVDEARRAVPASEWSLGAGGMGLNEAEIAGLAALDVTSKGTLKAAATTKQAEIAAALALPDTAAVATLAGGIAIKDKAGVVADVQNAAPVTSVVGVAGATGVQLAGLGVKTLGQLKDANPAAIAGAFGGNVGMAESAIAAAKAKLGGGL
jgi:hypothetical protein